MDEYLLERGIEKAEEKLQADIADRRAKNTLVRRYGPGEYLANDCEDCGNEIQLFRKECGLLKCTICQGKHEKRMKLLGR